MVKLYVEGGGNSRAEQIECRRAFSELVRKAGLAGRMPRIVACGSRTEVFKQFKLALAQGLAQGAETALFLVDSEEPVRQASAWAHLAHTPDALTKPPRAHENHAQLMVTCMETWLMADQEALARYFGTGFNARALIAQHDLENRPRKDVIDALKRATQNCNRSYKKGDVAFGALAEVDPAVLQQHVPHFARFITALASFGP